jgi:hypothetical protein
MTYDLTDSEEGKQQIQDITTDGLMVFDIYTFAGFVLLFLSIMGIFIGYVKLKR